MAEDRTAVGILVDANDHPETRWHALSDRLRAALITLPENPAPDGTIIDGRPRVGVWLMPDNQSCGELEDFISGMIPSDDAVWPLSQAYIDGIPLEDRKFTESKILRAKVHAWLAARESPRPMGLSITAGDLDIRTPDARRFKNWLRELFSE